jgi:nitronate monooxygenase
MLGADGVLMGTRFWASREALVHPRHHEAIIHTNGDGTIRTHVADIVRQIPWPVEFTARVRHNRFTKKWHGCEEELKSSITLEAHQYRTAFAEGDTENTGVWFGEAAGLIHSIEPAEIIIENMVNDAIACLKQYSL